MDLASLQENSNTLSRADKNGILILPYITLNDENCNLMAVKTEISPGEN